MPPHTSHSQSSPSSRTTTSVKTYSSNLPAEIFFPIFDHVHSKRELCLLATTSRILQKPAEAALHRHIVLPSRRDVVRFCATLQRTPRFSSLVRTLTIEWPINRGEVDERYRTDPLYREEYWCNLRDTLRGLSGLEGLTIDDGRDNFLSWVLEGMGSEKLGVLRCGFVLDEAFLGFLRNNTMLRELSWTGSLVSIPSSTTHIESPEADLSTEPDTEWPIINSFTTLVGTTSLQNLQVLHTESLALARALVPGRRITHVWVPGASFATAYTSDYVYSHIPVPSFSDLPSPSSSSPITVQIPSKSHVCNTMRANTSLRDLSDAEISGHLCRAIRDFSKSKGPLLSLRLSLGITDGALREVLGCISQELPSVRALGFLPAGIVHSSTFPPLPNLHTLTLWSLPSPRALAVLTSSTSLPSLRTVACLHYSPSFEWICIPVNDHIDASADGESTSKGVTAVTAQTVRGTGGIPWDRAVQSEEGQIERRHPTAVHDPKNLLWRDV